MATGESLKRLGGGRWETKDGRFAIEPESGTWVIVDQEQTDELGLPLVRGPFGSLTAAKAAIDTARSSGPAESPLAERMQNAPEPANAPKAPPKPPPPPEPRWLRSLGGSTQKRARAMIQRLEAAGVDDAEDLARGEMAEGDPAVARRALERQIERALSAKTPQRAVRDLVEAILDGEDDALGATWRLVDGEGRQIRRLDVPGGD